jgi:hypothetical protein
MNDLFIVESNPNPLILKDIGTLTNLLIIPYIKGISIGLFQASIRSSRSWESSKK